MPERRPAAGTVRLDPGDAAELIEILSFLADWLDDSDSSADFAGSLRRFTSGGYSLADLQADLARFTFLLGDDGERFFNGSEQQ